MAFVDRDGFYEEGEFIPTVAGTTAAGVATYSVQTGRFTRVGNRVDFFARVAYSGGTGTGNLSLAGLPFVNLGPLTPASILAANLTFTGQLYAAVNAGASTVAIGVEASAAALAPVAYDADADITVMGTYFIN